MANRIDQIQQMLLKEPEDSFLNYALALELTKNGQLLRAVSILEKILNKNEAYLAAYYQLGKLYEQLALKEKAVITYKKGQIIARLQKNFKTLHEVAEALNQINES